MKALASILLCLICIDVHAAGVAADVRSMEARIAADRQRVDTWRELQTELTAELERLILRAESGTLSQAELRRANELWSGVVDLQLALDVVDRRWREAQTMNGAMGERPIFTAYEAWIARVTGALAIVEAMDGRDALRAALNEPLPQLGLPGGTLTRIQQMIETASTATEFLAFDSVYHAAVTGGRMAPSPAIEHDAARLGEWLRARGVENSARNASRLLAQGASQSAGLLNAVPSSWFGEAHRAKRGRPLISSVWAARIQNILQPGDLILLRHEWEPAGAGLSSYWSAAGIWIGSPAERRHYFRDPVTLAAFRNQGAEDLDSLVRSRTPSAYGASLGEAGEAATMMTTSPFGVIMTGPSALQADTVAVLRLRRSALDRAMIVLRAFELVGRPFDPTGDVNEQSAIGSAELILLALGDDAPQIARSRVAVDDLVEWFDRVAGDENPTYELLMFVEGDELSRRAAQGDADAFRSSWNRAVWGTWLNAAAQRQRRR